MFLYLMYSWLTWRFFLSGRKEGRGVTGKKITFIGGGVVGKYLVTGGGVMQLSIDTSKNSTSRPYFVKNERSLSKQ